MPVERVEDAARTLARAALGPPARDLATTRSGALDYALLRHVPRRLLDAVCGARLARDQAPGFVTIRKTAAITSRPAIAPTSASRRACRW